MTQLHVRGAKAAGDVAEQPVEASLQSGTMCDHFELRRMIGRGGMGEIYLARDTKLGRKVALKLIRPSVLGQQDDATEMFLHEARLTARFSHPNIVQVYDVGQFEGRPYLALEYLRGITLRQRMIQEEAFSPLEVARIGIAVAEALQEAHRHGVLHRDLKPANILLPPDGRLRVVDFGLARQTEQAARSERTPAAERSPSSLRSVPSQPAATRDSLVQTRARGTPMYMAPEQWRESPIDKSVDIWALGIIVLSLLKGEHPYEGCELQQLLFEVAVSPEPVPFEGRDQFPAALVEVIESAVSKEPSDRPSAAAVAKSLKAFVSAERGASEWDESPFRGLMPFTEAHARFFFGRDDEIIRCVELLKHQVFLPIVGASGTGKSSFVRAGLIPRLEELGRWSVVRMRPGARPFESLAHALLLPSATHGHRDSTEVNTVEMTEKLDSSAELAAELREQPGRLGSVLRSMAKSRDGGVILFVNQLEEVLTLVADEQEREQFLVALWRAADDPTEPIRLVVTVRDDFLGRLLGNAEAREAFSGIVFLNPPGPDALASVLRSPIEAYGYAFDDPGLPDEMVAAVGREPACLPLLQFAAQQLWEKRDRKAKLIRRDVYEEMGGVEGALAEHADGVVDTLGSQQIKTARAIMLRLVTNEGTRVVADRQALVEGLAPVADEVIERFVKARLLSLRRRREAERSVITVEIAHESLIARWRTLARWIDEGRDELLLFADVRQAATLWDKRGRRDEELWQGDALHDAVRFVRDSSRPLTETIRRFVAAGQRRQVRWRRRRRFAVFAAMVALGAVAGVTAVQNQRLDRQTKAAKGQRQVAQSQRSIALMEGARSALRAERVVEARAKIREAMEATDAPANRALWREAGPSALLWRKRFGAGLNTVVVRPDGMQVAATAVDKSLYLLDTVTLQTRSLRGHNDQVTEVAYSPDGTRILSSDRGGGLCLWDVETGRKLFDLKGHKGVIRSLEFSPDGDLFATGGDDGHLRIWGAKTGKVIRALNLKKGFGTVRFAKQGEFVASAEPSGHVRMWRVSTGALVRSYDLGESAGRAIDFKFSPNGAYFATTHRDTITRIYRLEDGAQIHEVAGHTSYVRSIDFSADSQLLATASEDKTVNVWNVKSGRLFRRLEGHSGIVWHVDFADEGRRLASASEDRTVRFVDLARPEPKSEAAGHTSYVYSAKFSPDGQTVATGSVDHTARIWDALTGEQLMVLRGHANTITGLDFSPDGAQLITASGDKTLRLWDTKTGQRLKTFSGHTIWVNAVGFHPDGRRVASTGRDGVVRVWDVQEGQLLRELRGHVASTNDVDFSRDGKWLLTSGTDRTVRLWDTVSWKEKRVFRGHSGAVFGASFRDDGKVFASVSFDETVRLWDPLDGQLSKASASKRAYDVSFLPGGDQMVVSTALPTWWLWGVKPMQAQRRFVGHTSEVNEVHLSSDGERAVTASDDRTVRTWDVKTGRPLWHAAFLQADPPRLYSHRGWQRLGLGGNQTEAPTTRWQKAVERDARTAVLSPDNKTLCLLGFDGSVQRWSIARDERLSVLERVAARQVVALDEGCLLIEAPKGSEGVRLLASTPRVVAVPGRPRVLGPSPKGALVGSGQHVYVLDESLAKPPLARLRTGEGVSALLGLDDGRIVVGFANGGLEIRRAALQGQSSASDTLVLAKPPSSPVTRLHALDKEVIVVGFGDGTIGLWDLQSGRKLMTKRLHGPVNHLAVSNRVLFATSALGQHAAWDLQWLYVPRCELMRAVWKKVPFVWRDGRAKLAPPPAGHPCRVDAAEPSGSTSP